ncbi:MAG: ACT domain-containing protein [Gammaproteobacteria bacterium]
MLNYIVLTALGKNHPQIIEKCSKAIKESGCNIVDSRVIVLGQELSLSMMLSGSWNAVAKLEHMLPSLKKQLKIDFQFRRTDPPDKTGNGMPYAIEIVSMDRIGIVHDITDFLVNNNIDIQDMFTNTYKTTHSGTPMFSLHATIDIPADISISVIRGEFNDFCDRLNLDAIMEPVK